MIHIPDKTHFFKGRCNLKPKIQDASLVRLSKQKLYYLYGAFKKKMIIFFSPNSDVSTKDDNN